MATTISFTCPECKAQLKGPAQMQGKKARCKRCNHIFVLKANAPAAPAVPASKGQAAKATTPPPRPAPPKPPGKKPHESDTGLVTYSFQDAEGAAAAADEAAANADAPISHADNLYDVTELDLAPRCPFCASELESEDSIICLHCGYNNQTRTLPGVQRTYANTGGEIFIWLLPGILCVAGILALGGFIAFLWLGLSPNKASKEWYDEAGFIQAAQVWGTIFSLGVCFFFALFAIKRLILHPTPPEMEKK